MTNADLNTLARVTAEVFGLQANEVLVTDYLDNTLTFDILRPTVYSHQIVGRGAELLDAVRKVDGVMLSPHTRVSSNGMLGWITADDELMTATLAKAEHLATQITDRIAKRVGVLSTGAELVSGDVKDTNWQAISDCLGAFGFDCERLGALPDDQDLITGSIRRAADSGFSVVITTGGVGAESKDRSVEAVLSLIPNAATRYTCHFPPGHGRHTKDGVRVAVGTYEACRVITLPGPNHEVLSCLGHVAEGLTANASDDALATTLAHTLRQLLRDCMAEPGSQS